MKYAHTRAHTSTPTHPHHHTIHILSPFTHTHTHTHTNTHTHTRTHPWTHTHAHTHARTHARTCTDTDTDRHEINKNKTETFVPRSSGRKVTWHQCAALNNSSAIAAQLLEVGWNSSEVKYVQCEITVSNNFSDVPQHYPCPNGYDYDFRKDLSFRTEVRATNRLHWTHTSVYDECSAWDAVAELGHFQPWLFYSCLNTHFVSANKGK